MCPETPKGRYRAPAGLVHTTAAAGKRPAGTAASGRCSEPAVAAGFDIWAAASSSAAEAYAAAAASEDFAAWPADTVACNVAAVLRFVDGACCAAVAVVVVDDVTVGVGDLQAAAAVKLCFVDCCLAFA